MNWDIKSESIIIHVDASLASEFLNNYIKLHSIDGWEPWHMAGAVIDQQEHIKIWFKRLLP